jgi:hypothetical protein
MNAPLSAIWRAEADKNGYWEINILLSPDGT